MHLNFIIIMLKKAGIHPIKKTKSKGTLMSHVNKNDVSLHSGPVQISIYESVSHGMTE